MIKQWLEEYKPKTQEQAEQALREIMQEIALTGLQRSGFYEKAAFYGGTALRVFYGLDRFVICNPPIAAILLLCITLLSHCL